MNQKNSHERKLSPELVDKIQRRWSVVYRAVENEHKGELTIYPDLVQRPAAKLPETRQEIAQPIASTAMDFMARREQQLLTEQEQKEQRIADALAAEAASRAESEAA